MRADHQQWLRCVSRAEIRDHIAVLPLASHEHLLADARAGNAKSIANVLRSAIEMIGALGTSRPDVNAQEKHIAPQSSRISTGPAEIRQRGQHRLAKKRRGCAK